MATRKSTPTDPSNASENQEHALFSPSQSSGYQQPRGNWRENWRAVFEQCSECFVRY